MPNSFRLGPASAMWATVVAILLVLGTFVGEHAQGEYTIHHVGEAATAVSEAQTCLTDAFLKLTLSDDKPYARHMADALKDLADARRHIDFSLSRLDVPGGPVEFSAKLKALGQDTDRLIGLLPGARPSTIRLSREYANVHARADEVNAAAQALWQASSVRLDDVFTRSVIALIAILAVVLCIVLFGALAHRRSVAARMAAEAETERQASMLRAIADGTSDAVFVKDLQGRYLYANRAAAEFVGRPVDDMIGRDDSELFEHESAAFLIARDRALMTANRSETAEEHLIAAGVARTYLVTKGPMRDQHNNVIGLIGVSCDITARKRDELKFRESEKRLELALAAARLGVWSVKVDGTDASWSPEILAMVGWDSAPPTLEAMFALVLPEDRPAAVSAFEAAVRQGVAIEVPLRFTWPDGQLRWLQISGEITCDANGMPIVMQGVASDVTDRMRLQADLRLSQERYRHFLELLPDAVIVNENDVIAYCNPAYVALRGAESASELIGTSVFDMFDEHEQEVIRRRAATLRAERRTHQSTEVRIRRLDGGTVPVLATAIGSGGAPSDAILVVLHDLRREQHAEVWAQSILSHTQDSIISTDRFGTITSFNTAAEHSLGYVASDVIGSPIATILPESAPADVGRRREMNGLCKNGTAVPLDVAVSQFEIDGERHIIAVARDVSERRKLEAELRQAHKMEALGQVAGGVAHDFNNLLTVILGYSDMLQDQFPDGDPRRQFASDIRRASGRAADLTRQLLTFSRRTVVAPKVIDMNAVMKDMNRMLRRVLGEDIELVLALDAESPSVFIDPGSLEQIVMNLCVNARDAMPTGGKLRISTRRGDCTGPLDSLGRAVKPGPYVKFTVCDTGEGMSAEVLEHIFEPFFTTKGVGKGTGLGLAVVLGLVEQNGGHIHLTSKPHEGTAFTIALPVVDQAVTIVPESKIKPPRGGGETILVVEDEEPVRRLAVIALASAGYRVLDAADGHAAMEVFKHHNGQVQLLLTDVVMPNIGGRQLAESLTSRQPALRVVYTSGYADDAVLRHGISRADVPFLPKPYTPSVLLQKVRDVIDQPPARLSH